MLKLLPAIGNSGLLIRPAFIEPGITVSQSRDSRLHFLLQPVLRIARLLVAVPVILCLGAAAQADFMEGWRAYQQGDFPVALKHWTTQAKKGDPVAQYNVGVMYDEGTGVTRDATKVVLWWRMAADQGHLRAQHNLALLFIERGSEEDFIKAAGWLERAAADGFVLSQYSLAKLFATGLGVKRDNARALTLFLKAGNAGFVKAQYNLGKIYRDGIGVAADPIVSADWFSKAANRGYAKAQEKLATRFADGFGVKSDVIEALKWAILATRQGRISAQETVNELRKIMSRGQISEAESRALAFQPVSGTR